MTDPQHAASVLALAKTLLLATEAMEAEHWQDCEKYSYSAARQSRMLLLAQRQKERDEALDRKDREK